MREQEERVNTLGYNLVARFDGCISAEHGFDSLKTDKLPTQKAAVAVSMMRTIKQAPNLQNLMNPGRIVRIEYAHTPWS